MSARNPLSAAVGIMLIALSTATWSAAVPSKLSYQAVLLNSSGQPVTSPVSVVFTIYDAASGGSALWTESRNVIPDAAGRVNVMLGDNTPVADPVFGGSDRWLGIQVGADPEMSPRTQFAASAYSRKVSTVDGSTGGIMDGNLTLRSTAAIEKDATAAQPAQLTLISLNGDTVKYGPADQLVFSATDPSGTEIMSATVSGPNGPTLGVRDAGGNVAQHSAAASSYFGNAAKNANALQERVRVTADGLTMFDDNGGTTAYVNAQSGSVLASGVDVRTSAAALSKSSMAACPGLTHDANTAAGNNSFGDPNDLSQAQTSLTVGSCNRVGWFDDVTSNSTLLGTNHFSRGDQTFAVGVGDTLYGDNSASIGSGNVIGYAGSGTVALGRRNLVGGENSIVGGFDNIVDANQATVIGDSNYVAFGQGSVVCFGENDSVIASAWGSILGGHRNALEGSSDGVVVGNSNKLRNGSGSAIQGGYYNLIKGSNASVIGGGRGNNMDADSNSATVFHYAVISGGVDNRVSNAYATIGGGQANRAKGGHSTIAGGSSNEALGPQSTVAGGIENLADEQQASVLGGLDNHAGGFQSMVGGGRHNSATGEAAAVCGGGGSAAAGAMSFIGGGLENSIAASGDSSFIGGGYGNVVTGKASSIGGGRGNQISTDGSWSTIGGGLTNNISGSLNSSVIGGGVNNVITAGGATIAGGNDNRVSGNTGTIPGGIQNLAAGEYAFATGSRAKAIHNGSFCLAANYLTTAGDSVWTGCAEQFVVRADGGMYFTNQAGGAPSCDATQFIRTSTGAYLTSTGIWTDNSDRSLKENQSPVDPDEVLSKLASLPISEWNFTLEGNGVRHIGPMAQDFYALFGAGNDDRHIAGVDAQGVAFAAIQALLKKTQELESQKSEIDALRDQIADLKQLVESMSHQR